MEKKSVVIALGYFDSVHLGHVKVINKAIETAKNFGVFSAVFTFNGNLKKAIGKGDEKYIFTPEERKEVLLSVGVDEVFLAPVDKAFISKTKFEFLDYLNEKYHILGYVSGDDYTFGSDRGTVDDLIFYAKAKNQSVETVSMLLDNGKKIATTDLKVYLNQGLVKKVNSCLITPFFITGKVYSDRKVGRQYSIPTANVKIVPEKQPLKKGVYSGAMIIDGKKYKAVINYGNRPTYNLNEDLIEVHAIDFNGEIYGEIVKIEFYDFIREIKKFLDSNELFAQIKKDVEFVKGENCYD